MTASDKMPTEFTIVTGTTGPGETLELGADLASVLRLGDVLVLTGDLGAGKTKLVQGIGNGLGVTEPITSPTFALANRYQTDRADDCYLHHLDVYRLGVIGEAVDLDLPDLFETGITAIEWGEQIAAVLPAEYLLIAIEYDSGPAYSDDDRFIHLSGTGESWSSRTLDLAAAMTRWSRDIQLDQNRES